MLTKVLHKCSNIRLAVFELVKDWGPFIEYCFQLFQIDQPYIHPQKYALVLARPLNFLVNHLYPCFFGGIAFFFSMPSDVSSHLPRLDLL